MIQFVKSSYLSNLKLILATSVNLLHAELNRVLCLKSRCFWHCPGNSFSPISFFEPIFLMQIEKYHLPLSREN